MELTLAVAGKAIKVRLEPHTIHLVNDLELWQLLEDRQEEQTASLVAAVRQRHATLYDRALDISDDSLAVEIWGHVYFEYFALRLEEMVRLRLISRLADKIGDYCAVIDCGESGYDHNRWFWDMLAPFRTRIAGWLPEAIHRKGFRAH